nr:nuclease domain-containing protein [Rhodothermus marinus]
MLSRMTGRSLPPHRLFTLSDDGLQLRPVRGRPLSFPLSDGSRLRLVYNPRWGARALLVPQQPDLLLSRFRPGVPPVHYVLDAKYRLDASRLTYVATGCPALRRTR